MSDIAEEMVDMYRRILKIVEMFEEERGIILGSLMIHAHRTIVHEHQKLIKMKHNEVSLDFDARFEINHKVRRIVREREELKSRRKRKVR